jgi:hypothetical protein
MFYVDNYADVVKRYNCTVPTEMFVYVDYSSADFIYNLNKKAKVLCKGCNLHFVRCLKDNILNRIMVQWNIMDNFAFLINKKKCLCVLKEYMGAE